MARRRAPRAVAPRPSDPDYAVRQTSAFHSEAPRTIGRPQSRVEVGPPRNDNANTARPSPRRVAHGGGAAAIEHLPRRVDRPEQERAKGHVRGFGRARREAPRRPDLADDARGEVVPTRDALRVLA